MVINLKRAGYEAVEASNGEEALRLYDLYVPLVDEVDSAMPYETAKELVLKATEPLGETYQSLLKRAFSER